MPLPEARAVDPELLALVDQLATERFGRADLRGPALARAVRELSATYTVGREHMPELAGDAAALCARLRFFLPRDLPKITAPLLELAAVSALPARRTLRVLDLGAGLGASTLGALEVLADRGVSALSVDAVDLDASALALARALCERRARALGLALELRAHVHALAPAQLPSALRGPYDLILLGFVLNELAHGSEDAGLSHAFTLRALCARLAGDGALIALEPALRGPSRALQEARGHLIAGGGPPHVFAPCLHRAACPLLERERDWCHERLHIPLPKPIAALARDAGLRDTDLSYSYLTLTAAPRSLAELGRGPDAPLRVVTAPLPSKGKLELGVCSAGPARKLRRLDRHARLTLPALDQAGRGSVLQVRGAELRGDALLLAEGSEVSAL